MNFIPRNLTKGIITKSSLFISRISLQLLMQLDAGFYKILDFIEIFKRNAAASANVRSPFGHRTNVGNKDPGTRAVVPDSDPSSYTTPSAFSPPSSGWIGVVPTEHGAPEHS
jgi:hypothetical protein